MRRRSSGDPLERKIEIALDLGGFVGNSFSFVSDLEEVANRIAPLIRSDPKRAISLYETFLGGAFEKIETVHDSGGIFGDFVGELFCNWVRARQASGADADETVGLILAKMDADDYALTDQIEGQLAKALDKEGRASLDRHVTKRFEDAAAAERAGTSNRNESRQWADVLRALYLHQRAVTKYIALCERAEISPDDCEAIAKMLRARRRTDEALRWIDRGIALQRERGRGSAGSLQELKRAILAKSGRRDDALQSAWSELEDDPNRFTYESLMRYVPKRETKAWHEKAMRAAEKGDLAAAIELFLATYEIDRLLKKLRAARDAELEGLSHYIAEPPAKKLEKMFPDIAARLYRAMGMRIVKAKKSRIYDAALRHFEKARECYRRAGLDEIWDALAAQVRQEHHRKYTFIAGFERIAGGTREQEESFGQRARKRWSSGRGAR